MILQVPMRTLLIGCLMLLGACASNAPLPATPPDLQLPRQLHVQRIQGEQRQDWMLVIQREDNALRWSLLDFLGIPQARQRLVDNQWHADGLLPPNPQARELFAALLFALTRPDQLISRYPHAYVGASDRHLDERWAVHYRNADEFTLTLAHGLSYQISPLPEQSQP